MLHLHFYKIEQNQLAVSLYCNRNDSRLQEEQYLNLIKKIYSLFNKIISIFALFQPHNNNQPSDDPNRYNIFFSYILEPNPNNLEINTNLFIDFHQKLIQIGDASPEEKYHHYTFELTVEQANSLKEIFKNILQGLQNQKSLYEAQKASLALVAQPSSTTSNLVYTLTHTRKTGGGIKRIRIRGRITSAKSSPEPTQSSTASQLHNLVDELNSRNLFDFTSFSVPMDERIDPITLGNFILVPGTNIIRLVSPAIYLEGMPLRQRFPFSINNFKANQNLQEIKALPMWTTMTNIFKAIQSGIKQHVSTQIKCKIGLKLIFVARNEMEFSIPGKYIYYVHGNPNSLDSYLMLAGQIDCPDEKIYYPAYVIVLDFEFPDRIPEMINPQQLSGRIENQIQRRNGEAAFSINLNETTIRYNGTFVQPARPIIEDDTDTLIPVGETVYLSEDDQPETQPPKSLHERQSLQPPPPHPTYYALSARPNSKRTLPRILQQHKGLVAIPGLRR